MKRKIFNASKMLVQYSFVRYFIIGVLSFGIDFSLFGAFIYLLDFDALPANMVSVAISIIFNFFMSNFWTFKVGKQGMKRKTSRYGITVTFNYVMNNVLLYFFITYLAFHPLIAKIVAIGMQISWTFLIYKLWVFRPDSKSDQPESDNAER